MANYTMIESRDPFDSTDTSSYCSLARDLVVEGNTVTLFLVQNGVLPARPCSASQSLTETARAGVEVLADDFSLRERGIDQDRLCEGVKAAPLDVVIDHMAEGRKTMWH